MTGQPMPYDKGLAVEALFKDGTVYIEQRFATLPCFNDRLIKSLHSLHIPHPFVSGSAGTRRFPGFAFFLRPAARRARLIDLMDGSRDTMMKRADRLWVAIRTV